MYEYLGINLLYLLSVGFLSAILAIALAISLLRHFDKNTGYTWSRVYAILASEPIALGIYHGLRILAVILGVCLLIGFIASRAIADEFPSRYDGAIASSVEKWWPDNSDPRWWKAQLYQESLLDPDATSPVGAMGLAQFMPGTWNDVARSLGYGQLTPYMAEPAIDAGAYYMAKLYYGWSAPRSDMDRWDLARASYNAGFGSLLRAQQRCGQASGYRDIIRCLPEVTGRHAVETITYVDRIHRWYARMACLQC